MRDTLPLALAITFVAVAGCSEGHVEPFPGAVPMQPMAGAAPEPGCGGTAIFDPVPALDCASLAAAAPAASVDALPGGYWTGQFLNETQAVQGYMQAMVGEDGRFQILAYRTNETNLCNNWEAALSGTMTTDGNALSGGGRIIAVKPTLADGTLAADLQVEGVAAERDRLSGTWNASSGDAGCFDLHQYWASDYEVTSALEYLAGNWTDHYADSRTRLAVDADGSFAGGDQDGCVWAGRFGLIDDSYGLYEFETDIRSCDRAGQFTGLAWHGAGWDPGERWLMVLANDGELVMRVTFSNRPLP